MKYIILGIAAVVGFATLLSFTKKHFRKSKENVVLDFLKNNPELSSIKLKRNGEVVVDRNSNSMMPLASTVKMIIAVEYAEQAAQGLIDPDEIVTIDQLDNYYVKYTDGGAHMAWFKSLKNLLTEDGVPLKEVAKGMITFSSNANAEYLLDKLGVSNVNKRLETLGMKDHSEIYYFVSSLFIGKEGFSDIRGTKREEALKALSDEEYIEFANIVHEKLKTDVAYKNDVGDLGMNIQKVWSDRLPASTTSAYVDLLEKLNSRTYFSPEVHGYLSEVLESLMDNPANQKWLEHSGMKGGSTAFVLTKAIYATDKNGNSTELAYFFNNLGIQDNSSLQRAMNNFELEILTNEEFFQEVVAALSE
ncbi:serine hydrolase [Portibacter lacus]|uniref:beta-lactamase n=1 Tax=Portibacter lacus TaxID=1099794 RepID=A0AA37WEY8_9BACT|nr:serine hydrolase [Portibacter lacus]GLR17234.1 D-alanyl-D-alanine carboxypeptidase [Portibacter lacus]